MKYSLFKILSLCILILQTTVLFAQDRYVSGTITDANTREPLPGASVLVKGTQRGVASDLDGKFQISVSPEEVLVFSFVGYKPQEINAKKKTINVALEEATILNDVVVVGYGSVKRANLAGAVATTDAKTFESKPSNTPVAALQGVVPGLTVERGSSRPGGDNSIKIRDLSSVNGGSPLVLIDGAEGDLNQLNPNDIKDISVLKDAQASIYGNRAANGVILVTTKNAEKGTVKINANAYYAIKHSTNIKQKVSLLQFAEMDREACADGSDNPVYTEEELDLIRQNSDLVIPNGYLGYAKHFKNHDWTKSLIGNSNLQNYSLNLSGGSDLQTFYISGFMQLEDGPLKFGTDDSKRYSIRAKNDINITDNLKFHSNISYEAHDRKFSNSAHRVEGWALLQCPWAPLYNENGDFYAWQGYGNPAQDLEQGGNTKWDNSILTFNFSADWQIVKGLQVVAQTVLKRNVNHDVVENRRYALLNWDGSLNRYNRTENSATEAFSKQWYRNYNFYAEYANVFAQKHDFKVMAGFQHEEFDNHGFSATAKRFSTDNFNLHLGDIKDQLVDGAGWGETMRSVYARIGYVFDNRYILEINGRYDGTSRFAPGHRWGLFTGYSGAWRISEEKFMRTLNIFDQLKVRASWGQMGNCQGGIGRYDYIDLINFDNTWLYPFDKVNGAQSITSSMSSKARTWEKIEVTNIGLDMGVLNNRLNLTFDYFWKKNKNMLVSIEYPDILGATPPASNNGKLNVHGWELSLGWRDNVNDFSYGVRVNLADAKNKVTNLGGFNGLSSGLISTIQGYATNAYFGYVSGGIIKDQETLNRYKSLKGVPNNLKIGDMMYLDMDGDGAITATGDPSRGYQGDLVYLGTRNPRYNFGVNLDFEWKGFDLSLFFQGTGKRKLIQTGEPMVPFLPDWHYPLADFYHNTWSVDRPDAKYPILTHDDDRNNWNYRTSDHLLINAAYMRLKNLTFGYTLPAQMTKKVGVDRLRVYFSGNDLFEIHNIPFDWDPEEGGSYAGYPFARYFSFGLNLNF